MIIKNLNKLDYNSKYSNNIFCIWEIFKFLFKLIFNISLIISKKVLIKKNERENFLY